MLPRPRQPLSYVRSLRDGQRIRFIGDRKFTFSCCDCALAHDVELGNPDPHVVEVTIKANNRATAGRRRAAAVRARIQELAK